MPIANAGRFEDDFVNQRLRQLQLWMDRMCKHPVVAHSKVFHHFLTCTDDKVTETAVVSWINFTKDSITNFS